MRRLAQYFKTRPFLFKLKYFCHGDMRADEVDNKSWLYLLEYKPTHVFIHVGGNDISSTIETDDIFLPIKALVQELWRRNVVVMVGEVMPSLWYKDPVLTYETYEKKCKSVNDKLRQFLKGNYRPNFVHGLFKGRPHRDLNEDLVHFSDFGQKNGSYHSLWFQSCETSSSVFQD